MSDMYVLRGHKPVKCKDAMEWARAFESADRVVKQDTVGNARVSTVFLGINHQFGDGPPLLFETMIFGGPHDEYQRRYSTWDEAEKGHAEAVALVSGREG